MQNNCLPQCNYCNEPKQAEWQFVYGGSVTNDYAFCCTKHIPDMIEQISNGRNGEVIVGYLEKWNSNSEYNPEWNSAWKKFFKKSTH